MALIHKFKQGNEYFLIDVNSLTVHIIDELVFDILNDMDNPPEKNETLKRLSNKYSEEDIIDALEDINELLNSKLLYSEDLYENIARENNEVSYIKAMCLNVAHDCNLKCKYCFAEEGEYKGKRELMGFETGKAAIDFVIKNSGPRKNIEIDLFGGEPLMVFPMIKKLVEYGKEQGKLNNKNLRFTLTTNGMLLNEENMVYINENMGNIILSIDGRKEINDSVRLRADGSGCYDRILPKIKEMASLRSGNKQYYVRGTFTSKNLDFYNDVLHLAGEGFKEISIEPVVLSDESEYALKEEHLEEIYNSYDKLYEVMKNNLGSKDEFKFYHFNINLDGGPCVYKRISGCGAGHEYIAVTPEGSIYPCHQFVGNEEFIMGNVFNGNIDKNISETFKNGHVYNKEKCMDCFARFYCSGGCQANNYNFNKNIHIPYELGCNITKKRIECAIALKCSQNIIEKH